jgi:D-alanyl-D-alanine carboxypeptidase/D-alanyl-D-alanine-endopeptidase (penicillin-binding protein 4)
MQIGRHAVLWLTLCWVLALVLVSDLLWFARGGAHEVENGRIGVIIPAVAAGPVFTDPSTVLAPDDDSGTAPTAAGISTALTGLLADKRLGTSVAVSVRDAEDGDTLLDHGGDTLSTPASTTKITTAAAALLAYGPTYRLQTRVVQGSTPGEVVLIGGGDPTLAFDENHAYPGASRLDTLAAAVRAALQGTPVTRVVVDSSLFSGPATQARWDSDIVSGGYAAPVNALTADGGRTSPTAVHVSTRTSTPDLFVGRRFASMLGAGDVPVVEGTATSGAKQLAALASPPLSHIIDVMLSESDNVIAESMLRLVAVKQGMPATFEGGVAAVKAVLTAAGVDMAGDHLVDGSGLSRADQLSPGLLTSVLATAVETRQPRLRTLLAGLPVASYSGTLANRFDGTTATAGVGLVRAKTGTLTSVSALAGMVITTDGHILTFALIANGVTGTAAGTAAAEDALDQVAATLAGCGCS